MTYNKFMVSYSLITAVFGLGFVLVPGQILLIYGVEPDAALRFIGQLFGAVLISLALLAWLTRKFNDTEERRVIVLALLIGEIIGLILAFIGQTNSILNYLGWFVVMVYLFMSVGLAYFQFSKPAS